jgi:hypothetical protein
MKHADDDIRNGSFPTIFAIMAVTFGVLVLVIAMRFLQR